jgi:hypothetical protein
MWKKIVALALGIFMMVTPVMADEFGAGGAYVTGHSQDSNYSVENDGFGSMLHYDKDMGWQKRFSENNAVGIDPGMAYFFLRWDKDIDKEEKTKKFSLDDYCRDNPQPYLCGGTTRDLPVWKKPKTKKWSEEETINSHILALTLKPYWELYKDLRFFTVGGVGYEFTDDDNDAPVVLAGVGIQYMFTKDFGTSLGHYKIYSNPTDNYRRFDTTVLSVDFRF